MPRLGQSITRTEPNRRWTPGEEQALLAGVQKYGAGKWQAITNDPNPAIGGALYRRSNVDLKDKWRNMQFSAGSLKRKPRAEDDDMLVRPQPRRADPYRNASDDDATYHRHSEAHAASAVAAAEGLAAMVRQASAPIGGAGGTGSPAADTWLLQQQLLQQQFQPQQFQPQRHGGWGAGDLLGGPGDAAAFAAGFAAAGGGGVAPFPAALPAASQHAAALPLDAPSAALSIQAGQQLAPGGWPLPQQSSPPMLAQEELRQRLQAACATLDAAAVAGCLRVGPVFASTPNPRSGRQPVHAVGAAVAAFGDHEAALRSAGAILAMLLQCGARADACDAEGVTAQQLARDSRLASVLEAAAVAPTETAAFLQQSCMPLPAAAPDVPDFNRGGFSGGTSGGGGELARSSGGGEFARRSGGGGSGNGGEFACHSSGGSGGGAAGGIPGIVQQQPAAASTIPAASAAPSAPQSQNYAAPNGSGGRLSTQQRGGAGPGPSRPLGLGGVALAPKPRSPPAPTQPSTGPGLTGQAPPLPGPAQATVEHSSPPSGLAGAGAAAAAFGQDPSDAQQPPEAWPQQGFRSPAVAPPGTWNNLTHIMMMPHEEQAGCFETHGRMAAAINGTASTEYVRRRSSESERTNM